MELFFLRKPDFPRLVSGFCSSFQKFVAQYVGISTPARIGDYCKYHHNNTSVCYAYIIAYLPHHPQSILLSAYFDKKNLYEKMPPKNETAFVLFKLGLQNIRKLLHIANGIVFFQNAQ